MQTVVAPTPTYGSVGSMHNRSPFHPYRPPTPTARCLAADTDRSARFRQHPGRFIHARSAMQKTIGQLLGQEWKIDEADENQQPQQDASRAELEAIRSLAQRSMPVHRKPVWPTSCHNQLPDVAPLHFMPSADIGVNTCRGWNGRRKGSLNEVTTIFLGVSDMRENMSR
ncbi:hypothetical protein BDF19DRAFT_435434 [Syncephalis fuscata]|nr:hypothetical protein BDF19DRAFT_435434 [Syncephalis fuscata]